MKVHIEFDDNLNETEVIIKTKELNDEVNELFDILKNFYKTSGLGKYIGIKNEKKYVLDVDKTIRFYSENKKTYSMYEDGSVYIVNKYLYEILKEYTHKYLIRISNSEISNIRYILHLESYFGGTIRVTYKNGVSSYISRSHVKDIKIALGI